MATCGGAQVALQQSLILRPGSKQCSKKLTRGGHFSVGAGGHFSVGIFTEGNYSLILSAKGYDVTWNDIISSRQGYLKLKMESERINLLPGNVFSLENYNNRYNCILSLEMIEHVAHPDRFMRKCYDLLKKNGCLIVTTPNGNYFRNRLPRFSSRLLKNSFVDAPK